MYVHVRQSIGFGSAFSLRGNWLATAPGRCLIGEKLKWDMRLCEEDAFFIS